MNLETKVRCVIRNNYFIKKDSKRKYYSIIYDSCF